MTEVNANARPLAQLTRTPQVDLPERVKPRLSGGINSFNPDQIVETVLQAERRRLVPIDTRRTNTLTELEAFLRINAGLEGLREPTDILSRSSLWSGKQVNVNNEEALVAQARGSAEVGQHKITIKQLALNHQIASQSFASEETEVGVGKLLITVGENNPFEVTVDETDNSLEGIRLAINRSSDEVEASILRTNDEDAPFQLVLTSQITGEIGALRVEAELEGGQAPTFSSVLEEASSWSGIQGEDVRYEGVRGQGVSTAVVEVGGVYQNQEDNAFSFTVVKGGDVGGGQRAQLRWQDTTGRNGTIALDRFSYDARREIPFVDGLTLRISEGEVVVGDTFSLETFGQQSSLKFWLDEAERAPSFNQPSAWRKQVSNRDLAAPNIQGTYTGREEKTYQLKVLDTGQVGVSDRLRIQWTDNEGQTGQIEAGLGTYEVNQPIALSEGITLSLPPGLLSAGQTAEFDVIPETRTASRWWLEEDKDEDAPSHIENIGAWEMPEDEEDIIPRMPPFPSGEGGVGLNQSEAAIQVTGEYIGRFNRQYTFSINQDGRVGFSEGLLLNWEDDESNKGSLPIGNHYTPGEALEFDQGLFVALGEGRVLKGDSFGAAARTSSIQPAQDAIVVMGGGGNQGGLEISSAENTLTDVIPGLELTLLEVPEDPISIQINTDENTAIEQIKQFATLYNGWVTELKDLTRFDAESGISGPLFGDRDIANIQSTLQNMLIDPVSGLPPGENLLSSVGLNLNDEGLLDLDEPQLKAVASKNFDQVANLFRNQGVSSNRRVVFVGQTEETVASADGYAVNITRAAEQGYYRSPAMAPQVFVQEGEDSFLFSINGRDSTRITVPPGRYSLNQYASRIQQAIEENESLGDVKFKVEADNGRFTVTSERFGTESQVAFKPASINAPLPPGLAHGKSVVGVDVEGQINNLPAQGTGEVLRAEGSPGNPARGIRLLINLRENELNGLEPEANIRIIKGLGGKFSRQLGKMVNPLNGQIKQVTDNLRDRSQSLTEQIETLEERIERRAENLRERFSRAQARIQALQSQQSYLSSQLGGSGPLPGL